jgi:phosphoribosylglycinamide formyltransferase-1
MAKKQVAVLISGGGSNLQALIDACEAADYPAEIALVLSNKASAFGLERAQKAAIRTAVVNHKEFNSRAEFDAEMDKIIRAHDVDIVCLAGFMRLLTADFVNSWKGKMINIHPSLLPDFKGADAHGDVIAAGNVKESGCTVHFVTPEMDAGPIILQRSVPVYADDTRDTLAARVLEQEHAAYPAALAKLSNGEVSFN